MYGSERCLDAETNLSCATFLLSTILKCRIVWPTGGNALRLIPRISKTVIGVGFTLFRTLLDVLLLFHFRIVTVNFVISNDLGEEVKIVCNFFTKLCANFTRWSRWSLLRNRGTSFAVILLMLSSSDEIRWYASYHSLVALHMSQIVYCLSWSMTSLLPELCKTTVDQIASHLQRIISSL